VPSVTRRAGPSRKGDQTSRHTRLCLVGTSELPQSLSKRRQDIPCTRRGALYSSRRRVRVALKILRRRRGLVDERAERHVHSEGVHKEAARDRANAEPGVTVVRLRRRMRGTTTPSWSKLHEQEGGRTSGGDAYEGPPGSI
jgi:hypothetical protein